jgi:hypothetical protein
MYSNNIKFCFYTIVFQKIIKILLFIYLFILIIISFLTRLRIIVIFMGDLPVLEKTFAFLSLEYSIAYAVIYHIYSSIV